MTNQWLTTHQHTQSNASQVRMINVSNLWEVGQIARPRYYARHLQLVLIGSSHQLVCQLELHLAPVPPTRYQLESHLARTNSSVISNHISHCALDVILDDRLVGTRSMWFSLTTCWWYALDVILVDRLVGGTRQSTLVDVSHNISVLALTDFSHRFKLYWWMTLWWPPSQWKKRSVHTCWSWYNREIHCLFVSHANTDLIAFWVCNVSYS